MITLLSLRGARCEARDEAIYFDRCEIASGARLARRHWRQRRAGRRALATLAPTACSAV